MITALDFGCHAIRSAFCCSGTPQRISMFSERAEYAVLPDTEPFRLALETAATPYAECEDSLVIFGNRAADVSWLSRQPRTPIFSEGQVPSDDAPARQILHVLVDCLLPSCPDEDSVCVFTVPGADPRARNERFLSRLISMHGWIPCSLAPAQAALLATGSEIGYSGITVVMGAETTHLSIARQGLELASAVIPVGADWVDLELARQFQLQIWDEAGTCYLDPESVRQWKRETELHLRSTASEREKMLSRLYGVVLDRVARSIRKLLESPQVKSGFAGYRWPVVCAGGAARIAGFAPALTECLVEQGIESRIEFVREAADASTAVLRGLLIHGELEARRQTYAEFAA